MSLAAWIERYLLDARKRRRAFTPTVLERLESRQLLVAGWSDALSYGPLYPGESSTSANFADAASNARHDEDYAADSPHPTPLPPAWQVGRRLPDPRVDSVLHPLTDLPRLNSYPQSSISLFLDFDGHFQADWGNDHNITTPAYTADNDDSTFTDAELADIAEIFARVAEDFAPFAINVTTVEPADLGDGAGVRVAIGGRWEDWYHDPVGGIAFINSFTNNQPNVVYTFAETLALQSTIAEATAHEAGHAFGLWHQSEYDADGKKISEYYDGDTTGAPIMGLSYLAFRTRWWSGTSTSATTMQDDLAVLSREENGFGYRPDDHGNTIESGTTLAFIDNRANSAGIVEQMEDVDVFRFDVSQSDKYRIDYRAAAIGSNLDVHIQIRAADGTLLDERTTFHDDTLALGRTFEPGSYQIQIRNNGTYGSLGQYSLQVMLGNDPTLPPTTPGDIEGRILSPTVVEFNWVEALGETHYELHATRKVGRKVQTFTVTLPEDTSTYTLTGYGVLDGWQYILEAINPVGRAESEVATPVEIPVTAPQNVTAVRFTSSSLAVLWDAVPSVGAYLVRITTVADPDTPLQDVFVDGTRTETILSGLQTGVDYLITVTARNSLGDVSQSPITVQIPGLPNPDPLLPPNIVAASAPAPFIVHLSWSATAGATLYQVQQHRGREWITLAVVPASTQAIDILPDGDEPRGKFRIVAANGTSAAASKLVRVRRPAPAWRGR